MGCGGAVRRGVRRRRARVGSGRAGVGVRGPIGLALGQRRSVRRIMVDDRARYDGGGNYGNGNCGSIGDCVGNLFDAACVAG